MEEYAESILEDEVERYEHYRFTADPGQTLIRVDKFLTDRITGASRSRVQQSADAGNVEVNGEPQKSSYKVKPGDVVTVMMSYPPKDTSIIPEDIPLDIVYEDNELLVVNKPAGMVVHPGHGNFQGTLLNALAWHFGERKPFEAGDDRLGLVHRIDKDTSGLLVIAKTPRSKADLSAQFFNKTTSRLYNALVWGVPDAEGVIVGNIGRDPKDRLAMAVFPEGSEQGKHAVTHYRVLESFNYVSLVECRLETGRTHQIRAHFKHIGHPLFADERYGGDKILRGTTFAKYKQFVDNCFKICPRQALHARTLGFTHPVTREQMSFSSPLPQDMEALIAKWREYLN
ncbi:MAG: RluA family pseudouridine synthase [Paludibacteraceae bacterium]|nr:RluA family pseudouridine synthase [Paludibacteraceae bacterium]